MYAEVMKQTFAPKPVKEVKEIYKLLQANFPFAKFCVYQGEIIAPLQHHFYLTASSMWKRTETRQKLFLNFWKASSVMLIYVLIRKWYTDMWIWKAVSFCEKSYLRGSFAKGIRSSHAHAGKTIGGYIKGCWLFYLQGSESHRIIENAFTSYTVNQSRLFRYAGRRKVKEELSSILVNWNVQ